jgi:outer membrane receptor for ferrienterochelin and colicin
LNYGVNVDAVTYTNDTYQKRFYNQEQVEINYNTDLSLLKWGMFAQFSRNFLADKLIISLGSRLDANNYSSSMNSLLDHFSPRFSASYNLNEEFSINGNIGRYYQLPPYTSLGFKSDNVLINKENNLKYIRADHYIAGVEYKPTQLVQFTVEGFYKRYTDYPFSVNDNISLANKGADYGVLGDEEVISTGKGRAYGTEFLARINNQKNLNANISYTLVRSEFEDPDSGDFLPSSWDSKHLVSVFATYRMKKDWSIGAKWRFVGGLPYTPYDMEKSANVEAWEASGGPYFDYEKINQNRFNAFHQLDVRIDKAFYGDRFTAKFYIDLQNAYSFQSESQDIIVREKDDDGNFITTDNGTMYLLKRVENMSGTLLPTLGIILEF